MPQGKTSTLLVHTPEGIVFSLTLAGPVTRFLAWAVDMACIGALSSAVGSVLGLLGLLSPDFARGLAVLASRRAQRLGDFAANTIVVRNPKIQEPDMDQLLAGKFNSLRDHPHLAARLHQRVSPGEARVALQALVRRDELNAQARVELFGEIAAHFRSLVEFPPETTEGITDEQHVRNVVDILFRPQRPERQELVQAEAR
jgi:hypothetical protein